MRKSRIECKLDWKQRKKAQDRAAEASQLEKLIYESDEENQNLDGRNRWIDDGNASNPGSLFHAVASTRQQWKSADTTQGL